MGVFLTLFKKSEPCLNLLHAILHLVNVVFSNISNSTCTEALQAVAISPPSIVACFVPRILSAMLISSPISDHTQETTTEGRYSHFFSVFFFKLHCQCLITHTQNVGMRSVLLNTDLIPQATEMLPQAPTARKTSTKSHLHVTVGTFGLLHNCFSRVGKRKPEGC